MSFLSEADWLWYERGASKGVLQLAFERARETRRQAEDDFQRLKVLLERARSTEVKP